jgi:hypothetical protein
VLQVHTLFGSPPANGDGTSCVGQGCAADMALFSLLALAAEVGMEPFPDRGSMWLRKVLEKSVCMVRRDEIQYYFCLF